MRDMRDSCTDQNLWYKLYADDMVLMTTHQHLDSVLTALHDVSARYNLRINPKKSAIFAVKAHCKLARYDEINLRGIQVVKEYCYLGVNLDESGTIKPHLSKIRQRSAYLRS
jgi:hypothetical protein